MAKAFLKVFLFLMANIADILVFSGATIFVVAFFIYLGKFAGMISLSAILIIFGLTLSAIPAKSR